ncbi:hypothetical protein CROQUDRAFT_649789 [Cronartium quercuum f. sp. fusiforme G11]|uniref:Ankyrin repeat protein n=1 Tax=Cronartium quercuum f. sp. fusiforme G11 TaxID=708437 RepID=A0A9P6NXT9_9BASI|nr:hypothetical protein CROQUDRAFT_649789 [Cronartium quercuum f. sp. fusiforme G11]
MSVKISLLSLPTEILHHIHLISTSENLPLVCKPLWVLFSTTTTARYRAIYLWRKYILPQSQTDLNSNSRPIHKWDDIVTNGCCTLQVLIILRNFHQSEFDSELDPPNSSSSSDKPPSSSSSPHNQHPSSSSEKTQLGPPPIVIDQIPTRLFKPLSSNKTTRTENETRAIKLEQSYQYIFTLLTEFRTSPDKTGGYPLARSVLSGNLDFIRLLLDFGARPRLKDNLVIMVAIEKGDLYIVRMLVERDYIHPEEDCKSRPRSDMKNKKVKREDRVKINDCMLEKALRRKHYRIADYLMGKGARPTLETIRLLESSN